MLANLDNLDIEREQESEYREIMDKFQAKEEDIIKVCQNVLYINE